MVWIISAIVVSTAVIIWQIHAACAFLNRELRNEENEGVVFMIPHPSHDARHEPDEFAQYADEHVKAYN